MTTIPGASLAFAKKNSWLFLLGSLQVACCLLADSLLLVGLDCWLVVIICWSLYDDFWFLVVRSFFLYL